MTCLMEAVFVKIVPCMLGVPWMIKHLSASTECSAESRESREHIRRTHHWHRPHGLLLPVSM
eukprot:jgi/Botrbrau1/6300/Bobra.0339s0011.1